MNQITDTIWIGTFVEARDPVLLQSVSVRSIVCLDGDLSPGDAEALGVEAVEVAGLIDGPGNRVESFLEAVDLVSEFCRDLPNLLVHCRAGRSRSVVVVAGYLMRTRGWTSARALEFVGARRDVWLTPGIEGLLRG